jgi:hypothetical protein
MSMAAILAELPDMWRSALTAHVPDPRGNCWACRDENGVAALAVINATVLPLRPQFYPEQFSQGSPLRREPLCNQPFPGGGGSGRSAVPCNDGGVSAGGASTPSSHVNVQVTRLSLPAAVRGHSADGR